MVIGNPDAAANIGDGGNFAHPSGIPQDKIDNIMSGIANTGDVKMNNHRKKLRQRFDIIKKLGQGTYGKVQLGINKETGQEVAIKTIKKCKIEAEADLVRIRREVQIMSSVQHPNIIHIYEVFENREKMVLVMEFAAGGELYDYLSERKVLSEEEARRIFRQVATAVYYCHKHKICHRDLKLENILLDEQGNAKIADFGLSNVFDDQRLLATFCGSPLYASPEIVEGTPYQGPEVDCWSLGVLLYTLVYGSMPFDGSNFKRLVKQISQGDYYEPKKASRASSLIRDMLTVCPRKRATIEQICSHWWVNENDNVSCLDLAEDLANQTPVRLDVLLSLTPAAITADQLVVPSADGGAAGKGNERVPRSHSVGSIRDMVPNTEAERRILDMVAAGGEAALMPSPTRTLTPAQSPVQPKRKLETTVSMENAASALKKKEKPGSSSLVIDERTSPLKEETPMETEDAIIEEPQTPAPKTTPSNLFSQKDMEMVGELCEQLIQEEPATTAATTPVANITTETVTPTVPRQRTVGKLDSVEEAPEEKDATKVIKKFVNKHKTADLINAIGRTSPEKTNEPPVVSVPKAAPTPAPFVRKCSLQDESSLNKFNTDRRKSRILETAEKFQQMNAGSGAEKPKKLVIPGVSVGSFKKEFERKATTTPAQGPTAGERRAMEEVAAAAAAAAAQEQENTAGIATPPAPEAIESSDSKTSVTSLTLDDARRSMENSIALLLQAQNESSKEVDQLCAKTENIGVSDTSANKERERKLQNARNIIGNAIQPASPGGDPNAGAVKTSTASITLKSATLPRRKTAKAEIQLEIKPRIVEEPTMRFTTEMQHPIADLRSAPPREGPMPYSPVKTSANTRATSLEPKEHIIPIQRPQSTYARTTSNTTTRSGSLSRQSTNDSESESTTTNLSQSTITGSSQPIKKSPREFIIPIAMEGGGFITPREGSIEPSESSHTTSSRSTFSRLRPTRRIGSLLNDTNIDESPFQKMRTSGISRDGDDEPHFTLHRLRSSRPVKKISQDNDSQSSGEEDDDDGFEILTAENLFSTLLQRVRALTNRLNVNNDLTTGFPKTSLLSNMRQGQSPFWNQQPFGSRLNNTSSNHSAGAPWRHSMSRDLGSDMESMFSRTGATLPRGHKLTQSNLSSNSSSANKSEVDAVEKDAAVKEATADEPLDLADLDLSRLRLSKKDLETLSTITPGLPKCFQEQLLAKLPPTQARKLSRTLSMQNNKPTTTTVKIYKRSQSSGLGSVVEPAASAKPQASVLSTSPTPAANVSGNESKTSDEAAERHATQAHRRSVSRSRNDYETGIPSPATESSAAKSRSSSVCRDDCIRSLCSSFLQDINEKYKYYSPYLNKPTKDSSTENGSVSPQKRYGSVSPRDSISNSLGRPPSGCLSPPLVAADAGSSSLRRRSSQRRVSRFLRPDFFEEPLDENPYQREKRLRERETQSVLREIREKSRESSRDRLSKSGYLGDDLLRRKQSLPSEELECAQQKLSTRHVRNKSLETYTDGKENDVAQEGVVTHRRSLSRPREISQDMDKYQLADKILQELQLLSSVRTQQQEGRQSTPRELPKDGKTELAGETESSALMDDSRQEKTGTLRKIRKLKPKEGPTEPTVEIGGKVTTTTVVKKVKKIVRKSETVRTPTTEATVKFPGTEDDKTVAANEVEQAKLTPKESKLKRPKSYPTKESTPTPGSLKSEMPSSALGTKLPTKQPTILENSAELTPSTTANAAAGARESRLMRPKSYPASKLTPPKEVKKASRSGIALPTSADTPKSSSVSRQSTSEEKSLSVTPTGKGSVETSSSSESRPNTIRKIIKVTTKSKLAQPTPITPTSTTPTGDESKESSPVKQLQAKEKSPEKKHSKGLLYAIGQKFEKLRDSAMSKDKKVSSASSGSSSSNSRLTKKSSPDSSSPEKIKDKSTLLKKKKNSDAAPNAKTEQQNGAPPPEGAGKMPRTPNAGGENEKPVKTEKRSRIDAMIRSLRERSVPRSSNITESNYLKRAVSVEEMPGTFNKNAVNRVLGLFRRFEKDGSVRRVRNARSTSNIERQMRDSTPSPIYQNTMEMRRSNGAQSAAAPNAAVSAAGKADASREVNCNCELSATAPVADVNCAECNQDKINVVTKRREEGKASDKPHEKEPYQGNKDKRKGLMLDLNKLDNSASRSQRSSRIAYMNGNGLYSNLPPYPGAVHSASNNSASQQSVGDATNNNNNYPTNNASMHTSQTSSSYRTSSAHEINRNHLLTPSSENIANYSSDSRSYHDDCASTSTFLSPSDEPELYFDNWSVCSEDNYMLHATPSPTVSRLSRTSQRSSPTRGDADPNESVIDRIKRRSFYCRFNDKKPKRTSSIVGPTAVRDYYREQQAAIRARSSNKLNVPPPERPKSPDITQEFLRPLKLSPVGSELKPPIYKSPLDYASAKPRKSLNDIRSSTAAQSLLSKRFGSTVDNDYLSVNSALPMRYKSSSSSSPYESNGAVGSSYYNTYNPKRRSSYTMNGTLPTGAMSTIGTNIDGYATVGRRLTRPYDQRTISLLDPATAGIASYRRDTRTPIRDYTSSISRSNSRYRTASTSRSPTNI